MTDISYTTETQGWQRCPICEGSGIDPKPMGGDVLPKCTVCKGHKIINMITGLPPNVPPRLTEDESILLNAVYGALWCEAYYDPKSDEIRKFAKPLSDKMTKANETLKFKP